MRAATTRDHRTQFVTAIGAGLIAGAAGTAAMTLSRALEDRLSGREPSSAPSDAAGKVLGVQPRNPEGRARFSTVVHWSYGTAWGVGRGLIDLAGLRGAGATATHLGAVWGWSLVMLPALGVAEPVWKQNPAALAVDALNHFVYASATSAAWDVLQ
jgi:hypothetical protein